MIDNGNIPYERASMARDLEYLRSMAEDHALQEAVRELEIHESGSNSEDSFIPKEDDPEIDEAIKQIPVNDGFEETEIRRILTSNHDMDIDDIIGISDDVLEGNLGGGEA